MDIAILALDGAFDTGLAAVLDAFTTANELAQMQGVASLRFDARIVGVRRRVRTAQGMQVPVVPLAAVPAPHWVVVPAIGAKMPGPLEQALRRRDVCDAGAALRDWHAGGARIAAACIATFVLAESGLLDGQRATTTWWLAPLFRQRYPRVLLEQSRMMVGSGPFLTAGAALGHMDLALALVRQASPELAAMTARYLVVDARASQSAYAIPDHLAHSDPLVERFEAWARRRLDAGFSLDDAASALATSKRTLARRMNDVLGKSPLSYFQDLRVERAVHLLKTSSANLDRIAEQVGYADGVTLGTLLRRRLGKGVREIRGAGA
ncbi:GlxA family transcriptional regulator [Ramlibacter alkalitolerans]|uniref:Helix-turn-helix domain-containing protein n=1 Tax=Ramlibacter alkalitolerans TaxID=2039631 RepID=A0ABS1JJ99_9BURK|nr:helix-turn-helix domain-containing protein [Ramlibacter alkalitolerans]MBL0424282.1 helix-turn-helix domain-containing protein [Ramlibacter alkalitolerans]